jgi:hypothetical protein
MISWLINQSQKRKRITYAFYKLFSMIRKFAPTYNLL